MTWALACPTPFKLPTPMQGPQPSITGASWGLSKKPVMYQYQKASQQRASSQPFPTLNIYQLRCGSCMLTVAVYHHIWNLVSNNSEPCYCDLKRFRALHILHAQVVQKHISCNRTRVVSTPTLISSSGTPPPHPSAVMQLITSLDKQRRCLCYHPWSLNLRTHPFFIAARARACSLTPLYSIANSGLCVHLLASWAVYRTRTNQQLADGLEAARRRVDVFTLQAANDLHRYGYSSKSNGKKGHDTNHHDITNALK